MGVVPDISAFVRSPESSVLASQALQGADHAARLGAADFRAQEERKRGQVETMAETADSAMVSAQGHQAQETGPSRRRGPKAGAADGPGPSQGGRIGSRIDMVV